MSGDAGNHERRISTVEANYANLQSTLDRMENVLTDMAGKQSGIKTDIALLVQNQEGMNDYQDDCTRERRDHEKRLAAVEGFQGRLVKYAIAVTGIGSLASPKIAQVLAKILS